MTGIFDTALGAPSFRHGIHPHGHKDTSGEAIRQFPFAPALIVPLQQHLGAPAIPVVREGQEVVRGQTIARPDGFMSVAMHAPASAVVRRIALAPVMAAVALAIKLDSPGPVLFRQKRRGFNNRVIEVLSPFRCNERARHRHRLTKARPNMGRLFVSKVPLAMVGLMPFAGRTPAKQIMCSC